MTKARNGLSKRCVHPVTTQVECVSASRGIWTSTRPKIRFSFDKLAKARGVAAPRTKHDAEALADLIGVRSEPAPC